MLKKLHILLLLICFMVPGITFEIFANADTYGHFHDKQKEQTNLALQQNGTNTENTALRAKVQENYGKIPLYFIQNNWQMNEKVKFYEKGCGHAMYFTERVIYLSLIGSQGQEARGQKQEAGSKRQEAGRTSVPLVDKRHCEDQGDEAISKSETCGERSRTIQKPQSAIVRLIPLGANKNPEIVAEGLLEGKVNYLIGNDPKKWTTNTPTYKSVVYKDIYKDIDMKFYGNNRQMEYDIIVKPGANPSRVQLAYQGVEGLRLTEEGDLEVSYKGGKFLQKRPYVYQEIGGKKVEVQGEFKIHNPRATVRYPESKIRNTKFIYGFKVASYDKRYPIIIDPALYYSTYFGGSDEDFCIGVAVDDDGNAYITGGTHSENFPTSSALYGTNTGGYDAFVARLNDSGSELIYSTYLGGNDDDWGYGIAVDNNGNAYITGETYSENFPTTDFAYQRYNNRYSDAFVTKLNGSGTSLVYSTYLGGNDYDIGNGIAVDNNGNAYITGETYSEDFPTSSALYGTNAGGFDAFVTGLNESGTSLIYSTYLGGGDGDYGSGIAVDNNGNAYITGTTYSENFPTSSALYGTNTGSPDAFVTGLNESGTSLIYSTYLGGGDGDYGSGIAVDNNGNAYITGTTHSENFPTVSPIYEAATTISLLSDAFVTKLNGSGTSLIYSTYLGGDDEDYGIGIAVNGTGSAYVTGYTDSQKFPTTDSAHHNENNGYYDAFVTSLDESGSELIYSTYLGGSEVDYGIGIAVNKSGNVYVVGGTYSADFSLASPLYGTNNGGYDAFVTKLIPQNVPSVATNSATDVKYDSAKLTGTINANGTTTTWWFKYGTNQEKLDSSTGKEDLTELTELFQAQSVGEPIKHLSGNTTYYYKLMAVNDAGTRTGGIRSFTTAPCKVEKIEIFINNEKKSERKTTVNRGKRCKTTVRVHVNDTDTEGENGNDYCSVKGVKVKVKLDDVSKDLVKVRPSKTTIEDENDGADFTITAKKNLGIAVIRFEVTKGNNSKTKRLLVRIKR